MIRKKKRKNPVDDELIDYLIDAYKDESPNELSSALSYQKQGQRCQDCNDYFWKCKCEYCDNCEFNRCLCDLGIERQTYYSLAKNELKIKVQNKILKVVSKLPKSYRDKFYDKINKK